MSPDDRAARAVRAVRAAHYPMNPYPESTVCAHDDNNDWPCPESVVLEQYLLLLAEVDRLRTQLDQAWADGYNARTLEVIRWPKGSADAPA